MAYEKKDFYYVLPEELIAQEPLKSRTESRLLVLSRRTGCLVHRRFSDILDQCDENDVLVLNNTKVIPARLIGMKKTGGKVEVFLLKQVRANLWNVLLRPSGRVKKGTEILFGGGSFRCSVCDDPGGRTRLVSFDYAGSFWDALDEYGVMPLPPYIKRTARENDKSAYQTTFATKRGAVAAPTAGLHFTDVLLQGLKKKGVEVVSLTLHVGYGTFLPVQTEDIRDHVMHSEYYEIDEETAVRINAARRSKKRIIACGTTVVRTLESVAAEDGRISAASGQTDIFIYPPYRFKCVQGLITNFHLPESTLLMLVSAFAGRENVLRAYQAAIQEKYRFFSYGDAMLIV
jgi:S-adenosylmethionine:tRNA ribosyltransferase-isomerase